MEISETEQLIMAASRCEKLVFFEAAARWNPTLLKCKLSMIRGALNDVDIQQLSLTSSLNCKWLEFWEKFLERSS